MVSINDSGRDVVVTARIIGAKSEDIDVWYKEMIGNLIKVRLYTNLKNARCYSMPHLLIGNGDFKVIKGTDIRVLN